MLRIISVYGTQYDYPTQIQESLTEFGSTITSGLASFAATNLKVLNINGTKLPIPAAPVAAPEEEQHRKTLPHAIARSSAIAAKTIGPNDRLGKALGVYADTSEKIGEAHAAQDDAVLLNFVVPSKSAVTGPLQLALNARGAVKSSRLQLDAVKQTLKTATGARQEQARLTVWLISIEVENAEDDLVQKTETAIGLMKAVLENPEPLKTLNELAKAQLAYHIAAAEALQACQTELEELSIEAEGEYSKDKSVKSGPVDRRESTRRKPIKAIRSNLDNHLPPSTTIFHPQQSSSLPSLLHNMSQSNWERITSSLPTFNFASNAKSISKGFSSSVQATRESLGRVSMDDITDLPQEYKDLETRLDAVRSAQQDMLKIIGVYATPYDYPTQIQESLAEFGTSIATGLASFTATSPKTTNPPPLSAPKTLPHAIARSSAAASKAVGAEDRLGKALDAYASASQKIGEAHIIQDDAVVANYTSPMNNYVSVPIALAMKARTGVRNSRLELDAAKQALKSAPTARQEQARLDVENAEDDLVQKTEIALSLMRTALNDLAYHISAAEALQACQKQLEKLSVEAEGEFK
ncbi:hypothetical protein FRB90_011843 [Tulasnella sp. 427]|nr:hypothetical protein FRB90_011843 [Tulasnella sp. 427]